jgi:transposase-like protein
MVPVCPKCVAARRPVSNMNRHGFYFRACDSRYIQRYWCKACGGSPSDATNSKWFRHKKRRFHEALREHFASLGAVRRGARKFKVNRKTIARKLVLLGEEAEALLQKQNRERSLARVIEFDDLETFEHTKCKPLSVTLAVQARTRRILGLEISTMPAKGMLVEKAKKYGPREDRRAEGRERLFTAIKSFVHPEAMIKSVSNPHYPPDVKRHFPQARHVTYLSRRGSNTGGGEIKEGGFDPLFSLNHTCASFRMNVTTKRPDRLRANLFLYAVYHNDNLEK